MIEKVLIPTDGSEDSFKAVEFGADIASKYDAVVHLLHVIPVDEVPEAIRRFARSEHLSDPPSFVHHKYIAENILNEGKQRAAQHGTDNAQTIVADGDPAETIAQYAKESGIDLIVLGSRGLSDFMSLVMGSVSHKVMHLAECTCVVVR